MAKSKKYDCCIQHDDAGWRVEIIRKVTAKKTVISKRQGGFATEPEAIEWGQNEVKTLLQQHNERNKLRSQQHETGKSQGDAE